MSGIAGVVYLDNRKAEESTATAMLRAIQHRGPDATGTWVDGQVAFGHTMLRTTAESMHERMPLSFEGPGLVLTADARIDNRDDLIHALHLDLRANWTDSELIVRAYEKWGQDCPQQLLGDFAFAVWNAKDRTLFCARDHAGIKPFYYCHVPGKLFAFGSEIKSFLWMPEIPRGLNKQRIAEFISACNNDDQSTFYEHIRRLPAAHSMSLTSRDLRMKQYWSLDPRRELRLGSDAEYEQAFRDVFTNAVRCRLRSTFPVGSELSGGLDSSSIVSVALKELAGSSPLHTISAIYDDVPQSDEREYIRAIAERPGVLPHYVRADQLNPLGDIERMLHFQDEPFWMPNMFMFWNGIHKVAQENGVRVLLNGEDGDTVVSYGVNYLGELARRCRWITLARELHGLSTKFHWPIKDVLRSQVLRPMVPASIVRLRRSRNNLAAAKQSLSRTPELVRDTCDLAPTCQGASFSRREHWRELVDPGVADGFELCDRAAAPFSIERRYPFRDRRVVEFCLSLPPDQKLRHGWPRWILRTSLAGTVPDKIRWRETKADLSVNFDHVLLKYGTGQIEGFVVSTCNSGELNEYIDVERAVERCQRLLRDHNSAGGSRELWGPLLLYFWLQERCAPSHS
jgi:asparagine synthase (glutamine-hydrolysing)